MLSLISFLRSSVQDNYVPYSAYTDAIKRFSCSFREVETAVFNEGWMPRRYHRNQHSLSQKDQAKLFHAHVLIFGCGGLGGNVAEFLARCGIGTLTLVDGDVYEEHNLNRQNFSTPATLGMAKANVVSDALMRINPALQVNALHRYFDSTMLDVLNGKDVVVDALDSPEVKLLLASTCKTQKISFVHCAIAGWIAQCTTSTNLSYLYKESGKGAEANRGNLSFTASLGASMQAALVVKILLGKETLDDTLWMIDFNDNESIQIPMKI